MTVTNANNAALAALIADAKVGTMTHLITTKKGVVRGGKANPVTYGDDTVAATIVTGFKYIPLVERSKVEALALKDADKDAVVARGLTGWVCVWKKSAKVGDLKEIARGLGLDDSGTKADVVARLDEAVPGGMVERLVTRADVTRRTQRFSLTSSGRWTGRPPRTFSPSTSLWSWTGRRCGAVGSTSATPPGMTRPFRAPFTSRGSSSPARCSCLRPTARFRLPSRVRCRSPRRRSASCSR